MSLVTTRAILLRAHPYSETSRVLRFYTQGLGLVGVMARGVRRGASRGRGALVTFGEGVAVLSVRRSRELQSLREFTLQRTRFGLAGDVGRLAGASMAGELVLRHAAQEPPGELYEVLSAGLDRLEATGRKDLAGELLALVWQMVGLLGFGPELEACTACGRFLEDEEPGRFDLMAGGVRCSGCGAVSGSRLVGPRSRVDLRRFLLGEVPRRLVKPRAHLSLLEDFITVHMLGGRRPRSFRFFQFRPSCSRADRYVPDSR